MATRNAEILGRVLRSAANADPAGVPDRELLRRYADTGDQTAFAALVARHSGMVLGVCRRTLPVVQDAEDATQATFLVLARKAKGGRWQPSVANWLYTTARQVASRARLAAARRIVRESKAVRPAVESLLDQMTGREAFAALDEELDRLAPRYRELLVLCYLEGLTRDEAAKRLGIPAGTVKTRLERGRKRLANALTKRGIVLGAGFLALAVTSPAGASPPRLVQAILAAASGSVPTAVAELAKGIAVNGMKNKAVLALAAMIAVVALGIGWGSLTSNAAGQPPKAEAEPAQVVAQAGAKPDAKAPDKDLPESVVYRGRVLGPDGKPVAEAKLYLTWAWSAPEGGPSAYATTGPDGRFEFTAPKAKHRDEPAVVTATAANHGVTWVDVPLGGPSDNLTLQLVKDDVPITGQIVDLEGKPVPGATLTVLEIRAAPKEDLGPWLEAARGKKGLRFQLQNQYLPRLSTALSPTVTTDAEGRFKLTGIGRDRLVTAQLDGPTVASQQLHMLTWSGPAVEVPQREAEPEYGKGRKVITYYGASFRHAAAPTKPVVGMVRDKDTRKPLAGVTIRSYARVVGRGSFEAVDLVRTTTDAQGRYRLVGLPKGEGYKILALPNRDQPYVTTSLDVPDSPGLDPVTVDVELKRGVWIEGQVTDKVTDKPLKGGVQYYALTSNPNLQDYPGFAGTLWSDGVATNEDGAYRIVGLPGPGLIAVWYVDHYLRAPEREDEYGIKEPSLSTAPYHLVSPVNYSALARVDPAKGVDSVKRDVTLDPGWTFTGTVLGPDGKPLAGTRSNGLTPGFWWTPEGMKTAEFTVRAFNPRRPRDVLFQHLEQGLIGSVQPPKENGGSVTVRMEPGATVTGRLVGADGKPQAGVELEVLVSSKESTGWYRHSPDRIQTDREGLFRIEALFSGYEYQMRDNRGYVPFGEGLRSGTVKDLGEVKIKPLDE